jgi:hypothetical protein
MHIRLLNVDYSIKSQFSQDFQMTTQRHVYIFAILFEQP